MSPSLYSDGMFPPLTSCFRFHAAESLCKHLAFGTSLLEHVSRLYSPALFFTEALNLLPQLVLEQSIPALKALTLMVRFTASTFSASLTVLYSTGTLSPS